MLSDYLLPQPGSGGRDLRTAVQANQLEQARRLAEKLAQPDDCAGDAGQVNLAAIQILQAEAQDALAGIRQVLPFLALDRPALACAHLVGGAALRDLGRHPEAAHWCSRALEFAGSPAAKSWQVPILCLWGEVHRHLGQPDQALARLNMAARRAKGSTEQFHVHRTLAGYWAVLDEQKSRYHLDLARTLATTERHRWLLDESRAQLPPPTLVTEDIRVTVNVLGGISVSVAGARFSAVSSPRAALLLAFLAMNDGELLDEVAAQILPPDTTVKLPDKANADRVARVRQHISQARRLLGDPAAVICKERRLWLNRRYTWEVDLQQAILGGRFEMNHILPLLDCPWLQEIRHTTSGPGRR